MAESTIVQYTTPTEVVIVRGVDLTGCDVWLSFQQRKHEFDVKAEASGITYDGTDTTVEVALTQEQTASLKPGTAELQVNWVTPGGRRDATVRKTVEVQLNLLERVVEYGG